MAPFPSSLLRLAVLFAWGAACASPLPALDHGRLDLEIVAHDARSSRRALRGRLGILGLDRDVREHVDVNGAPSLAFRVWLRPGAYLLSWRPALDLNDMTDLDALEPSASSVLSHAADRVIILPERVTRAHLWTAATPGASPRQDIIAGVSARREPRRTE